MTLFLLVGDANLAGEVPLRVLFHGATGTVEALGRPDAANDRASRLASTGREDTGRENTGRENTGRMEARS
jgi:putative ABC transport system ATP-binding protein